MDATMTAAEIALVGNMDAIFDPGESFNYTCMTTGGVTMPFTNIAVVTANPTSDPMTEVTSTDPTEVVLPACTDIVIDAAAVCTGAADGMYFIEVISITGGAGGTINVDDGINPAQVWAGATLTFGPYMHSGDGSVLTTIPITATDDGDAGCTTTVDIQEVLCGTVGVTCDCNLDPNGGSIFSPATPGSFETIDYTQVYALVDDATDQVISYNYDGLFTGLANGMYDVYAFNILTIELAALTAGLTTGADIMLFDTDGEFMSLCYTVLPTPAALEVACDCGTFDLALTKMVNTTATPGPFAPGDNVTYTICVYNQGTGPIGTATNTEVTDYGNANLIFAGLATPLPTMTTQGTAVVITDNGGGVFTIDNLESTEDVCVDLTYTISPAFTGGSVVNNAEITMDSGDDTDSNPSDNSGDPADPNDDSLTDGNMDSSMQDPSDDDYDPSSIAVCAPVVIDAAAVCTGANDGEYFIEVTSVTGGAGGTINVDDGINPAQAWAGVTLTFGPYTHSGNGSVLTTIPITATDDGDAACTTTVDIQEVLCGPIGITCDCDLDPNGGSIFSPAAGGSFETIDYTQVYVLVDDANDQIISYNYDGLFTGLANGMYDVYAINVETVDLATLTGGLTAGASILDFDTDGEYMSLCYTILPTPAALEVACSCGTFDLALDKVVNTTATPGPYGPGSNVTYTVCVYNQGTGALGEATNTQVTDYGATDLTFASLGTLPTMTTQGAATTITDNGGGVFTISDLPVGEDVCVDLNYTINATVTSGDVTNNAEITMDSGDDIDSAPGDNAGSAPDPNDGAYTTDGNDDPNTLDPSDDDYDPATISICNVVLAATTPIEVCEDAAAIMLASSNPTLTAGIAAGTYVWYNDDGAGAPDILGGAITTVDPATATSPLTVWVVYTEPAPTSCTAQASLSITINPLPTVTIDPAGPVCTSAAAFALVGNPAGGTWSGGAYIDAAGNFDPSLAAIGANSVTYTYTDAVTNCVNSAIASVVVNDGPTVSITPAGPLCDDGAAIALVGNPAGGTFDVAAYVDAAGNFDPALASVGGNSVTYNYTDAATGCAGSATINITVQPCCSVNAGDIPQVEFCEGVDPMVSFGLPYVDDFWDGDDINGIFDVQYGGAYGPAPTPLSSYSYTYALTEDDPGGTTGSVVLEGPDPTAAFNYTALAPGVYRMYAIVWKSFGGVTLQNSGGGVISAGDDIEAIMMSNGSTCIDITYTYVTILPSPNIGSAVASCATDGTGGEVTLTGLTPFTFYMLTGLGAADGTYGADATGEIVVSSVASGAYTTISVADFATGCTSNEVSVTVGCDGQIGDFVWNDVDSDGTDNGGTELGIPGVTVNLTWYGPDGILGTADDVVYTTVTGSMGEYLFTGLPFGDYQVMTVGAPGTQTYDLDGTLDDTSVTTLDLANPVDLDQDFGYQACTTTVGLTPIPDNEVCSGELIRLDVLVEDAGVATPGVSFIWTAMDGVGGMVGSGAGVTSVAGTATIQDTQFNITTSPITITYILTSGCGTETIDFIVNPNPVVAFIISDYNGYAIDCNGASTGTITADMVSGSGTYTYLWSNGATTATVTGVPAGVYGVTVTDDSFGGCPAIGSVTLNQPSALSCVNTLVTNETCEGDVDGTAQILPSGGVGPYTFNWSTGATTDQVTDLAAGTYDVTVSDANGCECISSVVVNAGGAAGDELYGFDVQTFEGDNGGINTYYYNTVVMTVWGGTPPYVFEWDKTGYVRTTIVYQLVEDDMGNLVPGAELTVIYSDASEWTVTVTDDNPCGDPTQIIEFSNNDLNLDVENDLLDIDSYTTTPDTGGGNGGFTLNITGGGPDCAPYDYEVYFQDGTLVESGTTGSAVLTVSDLPSGWYTTYVYCDVNDPNSDATIGWYWIEPQRRGRGKLAAPSIQMYPNPSNGITNVEFNVPVSGKVVIDVYTIDGQLIRNLYNANANENVDYKVPFDGRNLPNGMYMVKIATSTGDVYVEKLILSQQKPAPKPAPAPRPRP